MPLKPICADASHKTQIEKRGSKLFFKGQVVQTRNIGDVLLNLLDFIRKYEKDSPCIIGHNSRHFDLPILFHHLKQHHLFDEFKSLVGSFIDTLPMGRRVKKMEIYPSLKGSSQEELLKHCMGVTYEAHGAVEDVKALQKLFPVLAGHVELPSFVFTYSNMTADDSLLHLFKNGIISRLLKKKLSDAGIGLRQLQIANNRDPRGIELLFKKPLNNTRKCTFSNRKDTIAKVTSYIQKHPGSFTKK